MTLRHHCGPISRAAMWVGLHFRKSLLTAAWRTGHTQSQHDTWEAVEGMRVICDAGWTEAVRGEGVMG